MNTTTAAELARLRTRFPDWDIIRTRCGTVIARHLARGGDRITAATLFDLEDKLKEWVRVADLPRLSRRRRSP